MIMLDDGRLPAAHVNWTAPAAAGRIRSGAEVDVHRLLPPFEVVTMLHSARAWERHHGPVDLYTDQDGYRWLTHWGLDDLYRAIDVDVLASVDHQLYDPSTYYTLGKVFALVASSTALTWLDTDLYLHRPIENLGGEAFVVAHREAVGNVVYPARDRSPDPNGIVEDGWDFGTSAANTALAYFGSEAHRDAFVHSSLAFAAGNHAPIEGYDPRPAFAERASQCLRRLRSVSRYAASSTPSGTLRPASGIRCLRTPPSITPGGRKSVWPEILWPLAHTCARRSSA
ncbi:hypothetical protein [Brachybacterium sp. GPGPB12]|uniref:hypothetical protein n=1 Tax=Brachybacterium sp. GPGPB12 TaxID=3023517 RepID=UPI0031344529